MLEVRKEMSYVSTVQLMDPFVLLFLDFVVLNRKAAEPSFVISCFLQRPACSNIHTELISQRFANRVVIPFPATAQCNWVSQVNCPMMQWPQTGLLIWAKCFFKWYSVVTAQSTVPDTASFHVRFFFFCVRYLSLKSFTQMLTSCQTYYNPSGLVINLVSFTHSNAWTGMLLMHGLCFWSWLVARTHPSPPVLEPVPSNPDPAWELISPKPCHVPIWPHISHKLALGVAFPLGSNCSLNVVQLQYELVLFRGVQSW